MGEGSDLFETGMAGEEGQEREKIPRFGPEAIHAGIQLGLDESRGAGFFRCAGQFASFGERREGNGEPMGEGDGKFRGQGGAEQKDRFPDAGLAEFGAFRGEGDAKLLATRAGEGPRHGDQTVAIGVVLDHGQHAGSPRGSPAQGPEVGPQGGEGDCAPVTKGDRHGTILEKTGKERNPFVDVEVSVPRCERQNFQDGFRAGRR